MKVGMTGTRNGMTPPQAARVRQALARDWREGAEFHHGDCLGADAEAASHARDLGYRIVCHPPVDRSLRAFFPSDETREPLSYFARNRQIVREADKMLAAPPTMERQTRGGTWYTIDYATKVGKAPLIAFPDGSIQPASEDNPRPALTIEQRERIMREYITGVRPWPPEYVPGAAFIIDVNGEYRRIP